jgi:hypothetical protein
MRRVLALAMVMAFAFVPALAVARDGCGPGSSGGGAAGGNSGGGAGAGGGGAGGDGGVAGADGGGISSTSVAGIPDPRDPVVATIAPPSALGLRLVRYARRGTALLRPTQEWTYDAFSYCAEGKASLSVLRPDGSFGFEAIDAVSARGVMRCMSQYGFLFDSPSGESTNFAQ